MEFEILQYFKDYFGELGELTGKLKKLFTGMIEGDRLTDQQRKTILIVTGIVLLSITAVCAVWGFVTIVRESHNSPYDTSVKHTNLGVPEFMKGGGKKLWKPALIIFFAGTAVCEWFYLKNRYDLSLHNLLGLSVLFAVIRVIAGFGVMLLAGFILYTLVNILINIPADIISLILFFFRGIFTGKGFDKRLYESSNSKVFNMLSVFSGALSMLCAVAAYIILNIAPLIIFMKNNK